MKKLFLIFLFIFSSVFLFATDECSTRKNRHTQTYYMDTCDNGAKASIDMSSYSCTYLGATNSDARLVDGTQTYTRTPAVIPPGQSGISTVVVSYDDGGYSSTYYYKTYSLSCDCGKRQERKIDTTRYNTVIFNSLPLVAIFCSTQDEASRKENQAKVAECRNLGGTMVPTSMDLCCLELQCVEPVCGDPIPVSDVPCSIVVNVGIPPDGSTCFDMLPVHTGNSTSASASNNVPLDDSHLFEICGECYQPVIIPNCVDTNRTDDSNETNESNESNPTHKDPTLVCENICEDLKLLHGDKDPRYLKCFNDCLSESEKDENLSASHKTKKIDFDGNSSNSDEANDLNITHKDPRLFCDGLCDDLKISYGDKDPRYLKCFNDCLLESEKDENLSASHKTKEIDFDGNASDSRKTGDINSSGNDTISRVCSIACEDFAINYGNDSPQYVDCYNLCVKDGETDYIGYSDERGKDGKDGNASTSTGETTGDGKSDLNGTGKGDNIDSSKIFKDGKELGTKTVATGLDGAFDTFVKLHTVDIPNFNSGGCSCEDYVTSFNVLGVSKTLDIHLCKYIDKVLSIIAVLLKLMVLYGLIAHIREIV